MRMQLFAGRILAGARLAAGTSVDPFACRREYCSGL